MPSVGPVFRAQSEFIFIDLTRLQRARPTLGRAGKVVGMDGFCPTSSDIIDVGRSAVIEPNLIKVIEHSIGSSGPDNLWHRIRQRSKFFRAGFQNFSRGHTTGDVGDDREDAFDFIF